MNNQNGIQFVALVKNEQAKCCTGSDGRVLWTVEAKHNIAKMMLELKISVYLAEKFLQEAGVGFRWTSKLSRWADQYRADVLNVQNAVAVRAVRPEAQNTAEKDLTHYVFELLKRGISEELLIAKVRGAVREFGQKQVKSKVEELLKSNGLTVDDLKKML